MLGDPVNLHLNELSFENVKSVIEQYLIGSVIFAVVCSILAGTIAFILLTACRKKRYDPVFIGLYDYFERHKILFYLSLISCVLLMGFFALQVRFEENITQFFPDTKDSQNTIKVFDNLKIKDKIIIMLSSADTCHRVEPDSLIEAAGQLQQTLTEKPEEN